jgi:hypothetical protein
MQMVCKSLILLTGPGATVWQMAVDFEVYAQVSVCVHRDEG